MAGPPLTVQRPTQCTGSLTASEPHLDLRPRVNVADVRGHAWRAHHIIQRQGSYVGVNLARAQRRHAQAGTPELAMY